MDPYKLVNVVINPDGTVTRVNIFPIAPPTGYPNVSSEVPHSTISSVDVPLNTTNKTWVRVFHPLDLPSTSKLPIVIYFHGGGFVRHSAASAPFHQLCNEFAIELPAIILSVEYRKAPENRLPAAYEDAVDAMLWLKQQALQGEHKFTMVADFTKCFLMGSSSGGNIVYHAGLWSLNLDLEPVKVTGLFMNQPGFAGSPKTESELVHANNKVLPLPVLDLMIELSSPIGDNLDHEYWNPMVKGYENAKIKSLPKCYVNGYGGDPLVDRQKEFVKMLEGHGVHTVARFDEDGYHGVEMFEPEKLKALLIDLKGFIYSSDEIVIAR